MSLSLPKHDWMLIEHNPQKNNDCTLEFLIKRDEWDDNVWATPDCKQNAIDKNEVWFCVISNPGMLEGMHFIASDSLEKVLAELASFAEAVQVVEDDSKKL